MSSKIFPSTGEKPKFDPNAAYEVVQERPAPKGKKPAFDPNKKFEVVPETQPTASIQEPKQEQPAFKPMTDWLAIPKGYQPMVPENAVNEHNTQTAKSSERIKSHLADIDNSVRNLLYEHKKDLTGRLKSQQLAINPSEVGPINYQAQQLMQKERQDIYVSPVEIESLKSEIPSNPVLLRRSLDQKVKDLTKSNPVEANVLKADIYRVDRQNNPEKETKIAQNIEKINKGEYDYDIVNGRLVKREGFFGSLATGYKEKVQAYDDYDIYKSGDEKKILERINKRLKDDPDEAIPVPEEGWITRPLSEGARMLGGQPLKPIIGGGIAGYIAGPEAGAAAAAAISAPEMYKLTFGSVLPHNYAEIKKQNPSLSDSEALQKAIDLTNDQANIDALSGAAMGALGAKAGFAPTGLKSGLLQKSVGSALKQLGETGAKKTLEGLGVGGVGAAGQLVKNLLAQNAGLPIDESEGLKEQLMGGIGMTMGMTIIAKAPNLIKPKTYNQLLQSLKSAPKEAITENLNNLQESGIITPEEVQRVEQAIKEHETLDSSIKPSIPEFERLKIQQKIKERNNLEADLKTTDKAYHPEIKEQIDKINEDIINISKGGERGELQKLVDTENKSGKLEGYVTEILLGASENDLRKYFKEIAEQAYDPNSEATTIATFGDNIVNKAKELYPDRSNKSKLEIIEEDRAAELKAIDEKIEKAIKETHPTSKRVEYLKRDKEDINAYYDNQIKSLPKEEPISEPTKGVSVIKPEEVKHPETITIKPKEDAIQVGGPEAAIVDETSGGRPQMEPGIPEPRETTLPQEGGIPTEEGKAAGQEGIGVPPVRPGAENVYAEYPATQLSFRGLQEVANEFGYEDVKSRDRVSDLQERKNAEIEAAEWAAEGTYQQNIDRILDETESKRMVPTARQRLHLEQYLANERQKAREIPKNTVEYDQQLLKLQRIKNIGQIARQEAGAALRLPIEGTLPHPIVDESSAMIAKMEANAVDKLTDQQKAEVEAQVAKYKQAADDANAKVAKLEEQVANIDAAKEFNKAKSTTKRTKKTAEERIAYRKSEIEAAREALKKLRTGESGLSAVPLFGVRELMAIAPHVKNIMVDLIDQGVTELSDAVKQLHEQFKDVLEGITEKDIHNIIAGEYNEKSKPLSELQRQIRDIQDEAKYINQLEALMSGKEPKAERAKRERNRKIKDLKDKIKDFRKEEAASNKFYGESDAGEKKLDALRDELERIQNRREKEKPAKDSQADKEISSREKDLRDQIEKAQAEWDKEKELARQAKRDYERMEAERNRQLQKVEDLKEKLENLQKGVKAKGKTQQKKQDTPEIESLKKQIADTEKELNNTLATEKRIKGLEEELDRLKQRKDKEPKEVEKREITDRERELKEQINEERKAFRQEQAEADKFYKEELDEDAKKLIAIKKRNQKRAQEIREKISKGQFEKEVKKSIFDREDVKEKYPRLRKDALDAIAKKEEAQHEFDLTLFNDEMARRNKVQKFFGGLGKVVHTSKAIMSGIDDSATFVQNGLVMLANPKLGVKVWLEHWKDAFSEPRFKRELAALHADPDFEVMQKSELDIVEPHNAASTKIEEAFEQNLLAQIEIKGVKPWTYTGGVFERAFTSLGNNMRVALFKKQMAALIEERKTFESHPEEYKSAARVINELTGRGKLPPGLAQASPYITPFIWAPRMLTSTMNTLGLGELPGLLPKRKGYYQSLNPTQRKFALTQLGRGIGMGVALMGAAAFGGAEVDYDPRSVTFGDVIIGGHHYNVFGRYTPVIKAIVQFAMGERVKKGGVQDLDSGKFGAKTRMGIVGGFFRGKMTPAAGAAYDLAEGKNYFTNKPFGVKDLPEALLQPMSVKELREGWENDGTLTILNRLLPAFEGIKTSDERDFQKKSESTTTKSVTQPRVKTTKTTRTKRINPRQNN